MIRYGSLERRHSSACTTRPLTAGALPAPYMSPEGIYVVQYGTVCIWFNTVHVCIRLDTVPRRIYIVRYGTYRYIYLVRYGT